MQEPVSPVWGQLDTTRPCFLLLPSWRCRSCLPGSLRDSSCRACSSLLLTALEQSGSLRDRRQPQWPTPKVPEAADTRGHQLWILTTQSIDLFEQNIPSRARICFCAGGFAVSSMYTRGHLLTSRELTGSAHWVLRNEFPQRLIPFYSHSRRNVSPPLTQPIPISTLTWLEIRIWLKASKHMYTHKRKPIWNLLMFLFQITFF